nr:hypothetical protein BaRGS_001815 [Batillaria attramentaria]
MAALVGLLTTTVLLLIALALIMPLSRLGEQIVDWTPMQSVRHLLDVLLPVTGVFIVTHPMTPPWLILDGQWDDVIEFIQPLMAMEGFEGKTFQYVITKHKYLELLCIKSEPNIMQNYEVTVDEVVRCLNSLESLCPTKEDYSNLCFLLSLPKLSDHIDYQNWNQLVLKGVLYESCVEYCQQAATGSEAANISYVSLLQDTGFSEADLSLLAWLQSIPYETFGCPFEQKSVNVDVRPLVKPSLEASWSEQILVTPIKPKMFPHSAIPAARPRSAEIMTRSLNPQFDGLSSGLRRDPMEKQRELYQQELMELEKREQQIALDNRFQDSYANTKSTDEDGAGGEIQHTAEERYAAGVPASKTYKRVKCR